MIKYNLIALFKVSFISLFLSFPMVNAMQYESGLGLDFESDNIKPRKNIFSEFNDQIKKEYENFELSIKQNEAEKLAKVKKNRGYFTYKLVKLGLKKNPESKTNEPPLPGSILQKMINKMDAWDVITQHKLWRYPQHILGYVENFSNDPGKPIKVYYAGGLRSKASKLSKITIKDAHTHDTVKVLPTNKEIKMQPCYSFYGGGCRYNQSVIVPEKLSVGEYYIILEDENEKKSDAIYFNVRPREGEGLKKDVVVMYANFTWQAYNLEGGGNFYYHYDGYEKNTSLKGFYSVSLNRPYSYTLKGPFTDLHHSPNPAHAAVRVLQKEGLSYRTISNLDLHRYPNILKEAKVLLIISHDEYWTAPMFKRVSDFVKQGGHIANFSGNLANWIVTETNNEIQINKYEKNNKKIPIQLLNTGDAKKQGFSVSNLFGVSYLYARYPLKSSSYKNISKYGITQQEYNDSDGITIMQKNHPVFRTLSLSKDLYWGEREKMFYLMYNEVDGIPLDVDDNIDVRFREDFPRKIKILAKGLALYGGAVKIGVIVESAPFETGGRVISFASIGVGCLLYMKNENVTKVFANTIHYLLSSKHENFNSPRNS